MRLFRTGLWMVPLLLALALVGVAVAQADPSSVAKGGRLYDAWWKEAPGASAPTGDHPLGATQTTNTRKGTDTWRCKECHGWDYGGKDGAYGSGSHKTGFVGVSVAAGKKSQAELVAILKGSSNPNHDFSKLIDDTSINNLASFLKEGLVDMSQYIDQSTKKPKRGDAARGRVLYDGSCASCHGADGTAMNFGSEAAPEYVGTLAKDNPWEFTHKIRAGQPGTAMPSALVSGWSMENVMDVLAHSQTLPAAKASVVAQAGDVAKGGRLYDAWWKEAPGASAPTGDHPLWATQTTNTRKGTDTWRCKECHGWDYKGKDGAYGSGSHKTGFVGVSDAAGKKSQAELVAILKGSSNPSHDFSKLIDDTSINNLASFLKEGLVDDSQFIDYASKKPRNADAAHGKVLYDGNCSSCHGAGGTALNFGSEAAPEFVGTLALDNPQEVLHKIRTGQPGTAMPSGIGLSWQTQDAVDVLAYAQSLPRELPKALPRTGAPLDFMVLLALAGMILAGTGALVRAFPRR